MLVGMGEGGGEVEKVKEDNEGNEQEEGGEGE